MRRARPFTLAVVCAVVLSAVATVPAVTAADREVDVNLSAFVEEPVVEPGTTADLTVQLDNREITGDGVPETAELAVAAPQPRPPLTVRSGEQYVGDISEGDPVTMALRVHVPENAPAGTYRVPIRVTYEIDDSDRNTDTVHAEIRVEPRSRFLVESTSAAAPVDDDGEVSVTIRNVGEEPAFDASVELTSDSPAVTFAGTDRATRFVGRWGVNETRTVTYEATVAEGAERRNYTLTAGVDYDDIDGEEQSSKPLPFGLRPLPEQTFAVRDVGSTLRVGEQGVVRGRIVNTGDRRVENAVVVLEGVTGSVDPVVTEYAVGSLDPGAGTGFAFDADVTDQSEAGPRQATFRLRYRQDGDRRESDSMDADVTVGERTDEFAVAAPGAVFRAGGGGQLVLEVTNPREEPVADVSAKLFVESPLSSGNDEAFVAELAPGETTALTFNLGVAGSATPKTYPVKVDFQYENADGETLLSDTYQVPLEVTEPEKRSGPPVLPIAGGVVVLLALLAGVVLYRRRNRGR